MSEPKDFVVCRICGRELQLINYRHLKGHDMSHKEYRNKFPKAPMISEKYRKKLSIAVTGKHNPMYNKTGEKSPNFGRTGKKHPLYGKIGKNAPFYGRKHTEESKAKMRAAKTSGNNPHHGRTGKKHPNYKDGRSFLPYCHLFNEEKREEVRNRWDRVCVLTDLMRSTLGSNSGLNDFEGHEIFSRHRLSVHHIYGNKMAGCDGTELVLIPLQGPYNTKKFDDLLLEYHSFYITLFMFKDLERKSREQRINGS